jgi:hypothetical protein
LVADQYDLKPGAVLQSHGASDGVLGKRVNPQGDTPPYWIVNHPDTGRETLVLERRLLTQTYKAVGNV